LAPWEESVTRRGSVTTSNGGEVAPGRGKGGGDTVGLAQILLGQKIKKIHMVDSVATNEQLRFKTTMS
jgi:hypothetical protein